MTATTNRSGARSRLHWVPAASGLVLGIIAAAVLLSSVSTGVRHLTRVPREFIDNYLFNFPDTSFAWAFALAVMAGALAARKRIAWWVLVANLVLAVGFDIAGLTGTAGTRFEDVGEFLGLTLHIAALVLLVLAYNEFWAKVRRGAVFKAVAVLVAVNVVGILLAWGLLELFPGSLQRGLPAALRDKPGQRLRRRHPGLVRRQTARLPQRPVRIVRRPGADGRGCRAVPVSTGGERPDRRGRVGDPWPPGGVGQERLAGLLRHPAGQIGDLRAERSRRRHLPGGDRRMPGQRRSGRRPASLAAGHRGVAEAVPRLRVGTRGDGSQFDRRAGLPGGRSERTATRRRGDPLSRQVPAVRGRI